MGRSLEMEWSSHSPHCSSGAQVKYRWIPKAASDTVSISYKDVLYDK